MAILKFNSALCWLSTYGACMKFGDLVALEVFSHVNTDLYD